MQTSSLMDDYMANYGQRLQSLLNGNGMPPQQDAQPQQSAMAAPAAPGGAPGSALPPPGQTPTGPAPAQPGAPAGGAGGTSFRQKWSESTPTERQNATDDLEKQLKQGNQTIDSAYDGLINQLGERPAPDHKLSREEKGMFLLEFGLSLMSNSRGTAQGGYGQDTAGAIGASGLSALQNFRGRRQQERDQYDKNVVGINTRRADAKADLAKQSALEARSEARDDRRADRENSQLVGVVTQPDNSVVGYTRGGNASVLELPGGKSVQAKPKPVGGGGAGGPRTLAEEKRFNMYMDIYGKDAHGQPLEGPALDAVKRRALQYAGDPKAATLSEAEIRSMAERSTDAFMKSNWAQFRDMKPDDIKKWRDKSADEQYQRLKTGEDAALELPKPPGKAPGRGSSPTSALESSGGRKSYTSQDQIRSALQNKEIKMGDTVILNGKPFTLQPKRTQ